VTLALLLLLVVSCRQKGAIPDRAELRPELFEEPLQTETERQPFEFDYMGNTIRVQPVAEYRLQGLVVSHNNIKSIADIYHDSSSVDTRDLCVVWGNNLESGDLEKVEFWSGPWTCYYRFGHGVRFDSTAMSNNHMITSDPRLRQRLEDVKIGDQIMMAGALVNYQGHDWGDFWRRTSTTRTDGGNGACEVFYFDDLEILAAGTPGWYAAYRLSILLLVLVPVVFVYLVWLESRRFSEALEDVAPRHSGPLPDVWPGDAEGQGAQ
jgi:hypothetical protein